MFRVAFGPFFCNSSLPEVPDWSEVLGKEWEEKVFIVVPGAGPKGPQKSQCCFWSYQLTSKHGVEFINFNLLHRPLVLQIVNICEPLQVSK